VLIGILLLALLLYTIITTIIGIALGIPVALAIDRMVIKREKRERKERILSLIIRELDFNKENIKHLWTGKNWYERGTYVSLALKDDLWKSLSDGGDLQWIENVELLDKIANSYYYIGQLRSISYKLYDGLHVDTKFQVDLLTKQLNEYADTLGGMAEANIEAAVAMIDKVRKDEKLGPWRDNVGKRPNNSLKRTPEDGRNLNKR